MLVLSRQKNESIIINGTITVTVIDIRGDKVRLGISAPVDIPIFRSELSEKARDESVPENQSAA